MLDGNHELLTAEVSHKGINKPTMRQTGHANDLQETSARSVIFRICGNKSQPGLQLVEKLATPLYVQSCCFSYLKPISFLSFIMGEQL